MPNRNQTLVRFLNVLNAIRDLAPYNKLSAEEEILLYELITRWQEQGTLAVSDVMNNAHRACSTTIYRRLVSLQKKGFVTLKNENSDKRVKYVKPAPTCISYMELLNKGLK